MRKFILLSAIVVLGMTLLASAQEVPQVEIFAGYSLFHYDQMDVNSLLGPGVNVNQNLHGWEGSFQYNINKWLGAVADIGGNYGTPIEVPAVPGSITGNSYNYLFGPQVNIRGKKMKGFAHVLFGVNHFRLNDSPALAFTGGSDNAFGMALGGGIDVNVYKTIAIRPAQLDYIMTQHDLGLNLGHQNNWRFSAGVVFNLGQK
jgi:opacity protein-like surface antigen